MTKPSKRQEKVKSLLQREISNFISTEGFEGLFGLLTITGVEVSGDLEQAKIFVSVIGQSEAEVLEILQKHIYQIQGMLNKKLVMRKVPRIVFVSDYSGEYATRISKLIKDLHQDE